MKIKYNKETKSFSKDKEDWIPKKSDFGKFGSPLMFYKDLDEVKADRKDIMKRGIENTVGGKEKIEFLDYVIENLK